MSLILSLLVGLGSEIENCRVDQCEMWIGQERVDKKSIWKLHEETHVSMATRKVMNEMWR
jgi:hypothetical protein